MFISSFTYDNLTLNSVTLNWVWDITTLNFSEFTLRRGTADILLTGLNASNLIDSYEDSNLSPGTTYYYYLFNSEYSFNLEITTHNVPDPVTHAYVSYTTDTSARVEWLAPICECGSNITNYNIYLDGDLIDSVTQRYYEFTNLSPLTDYKIDIKPVNEYGPGISNITLSLSTKSALPNSIDSAYITFDKGLLTWSDSQSNVSYLVQRRDKHNPYREIYRGLDAYITEAYYPNKDNEYQYRIKVANEVGYSEWSYSEPIRIFDPILIEDLELTSSLLNQGIMINVTSDVVPDYYEYRLSSDNGISWILDWSGLEPDNSSIVLNGLNFNSIYLVEVRAVNEFGPGGTNTILVNLSQLPPSIPYGLTYFIDLFPEYKITFNWSDQITWNDNAVDRRVYSYDLVIDNQQFIGTSPTNSYTYIFNPSQFNKVCKFKVKSINNNGLSSLNYSDMMVLTLPDIPSLTVVPVNVNSTMISFNISTLYNDDAFDIAEHRTTVEYRAATTDSWSDPIELTDHIDISNLQQNTIYNFRFRAYNLLGASEYETLTLTTEKTVDTESNIKLSPNAVTNLSYSYRESYFIVINYDKAVGATRYEISILDNLNTVLDIYQTDSNKAVLRRLDFDFILSSYRISVRSFNDDIPGGTAEVVLLPDITVPSPPTGVSASVLNGSYLNLTWDNSDDSDLFGVHIALYANNKESVTFTSEYSSETSFTADINCCVELSLPGNIKVINYKLCSVDHFGNMSEPVYGSVSYDLFSLSLMPVLNLRAILDSDRLEYTWDYAKYTRMTAVHLTGIETEHTVILPVYAPIQSIYFKVGQYSSDYGFKDNNILYQFKTTNKQSLLSANCDTLLFTSGSYYGDAEGVLPGVLFDRSYSLENREIDEISWNIINRKFTIKTNGNIKWASRSVLLNYWGQILCCDVVVYQFNFGGLGHTDWINLTDGANIWSASNINLELDKYVGKELVLHIYRTKPDVKPDSLTSGRVIFSGLQDNTVYNLSVTGYDVNGNSAVATKPAVTLPRISGVRRDVKSIMQFLYYYDVNPDYIYNLFARQLGDVDYNITNFDNMLADVTYEIKCEEINRNGAVGYSYYRLYPDNSVDTIVPGSLTNLRFTRSMRYSVTYTWTEYINSNGYYVVLTKPDGRETIYKLPAEEPFVTYWPDNGKTYSISLQVEDEYGNLTHPYYDDFTVPNNPGILSNIRVIHNRTNTITVSWDKQTTMTHYQTLLELYRNGTLIDTKYLDSDAVNYMFTDLFPGKYKILLRSLNSIGYYSSTYAKQIDLP